MEKIENAIALGDMLKTPSGQATFKINNISPKGVQLIVGKGEWPILIPSDCWEAIPDYLKEKGPVRIGSIHEKPETDTLDEFIQRYTSGVSAASYVAPILEKIGIAEIGREKPQTIRLV